MAIMGPTGISAVKFNQELLNDIKMEVVSHFGHPGVRV